jgi:hypothetical protein
MKYIYIVWNVLLHYYAEPKCSRASKAASDTMARVVYVHTHMYIYELHTYMYTVCTCTCICVHVLFHYSTRYLAVLVFAREQGLSGIW